MRPRRHQDRRRDVGVLVGAQSRPDDQTSRDPVSGSPLIPEVAAAADVPDEDVTLQSYVLADTMVLKVTVITTSPTADAALNELFDHRRTRSGGAGSAIRRPGAVAATEQRRQLCPFRPSRSWAQPESWGGLAGWWSGPPMADGTGTRPSTQQRPSFARSGR